MSINNKKKRRSEMDASGREVIDPNEFNQESNVIEELKQINSSKLQNKSSSSPKAEQKEITDMKGVNERLAQDSQAMQNQLMKDFNSAKSGAERAEIAKKLNQFEGGSPEGGVTGNQVSTGIQGVSGLATAAKGGGGGDGGGGVVSGTLGGAASGAGIGAMFGTAGAVPTGGLSIAGGAAIGAGIGATVGLVGGLSAARSKRKQAAALAKSQAQQTAFQNIATIEGQTEDKRQNAFKGMVDSLRSAFLSK